MLPPDACELSNKDEGDDDHASVGDVPASDVFGELEWLVKTYKTLFDDERINAEPE